MSGEITQGRRLPDAEFGKPGDDTRRRLFMQRIPTTRADLREAAERVYDAYAHRTREREQAHLFLASIASADAQGEQAEWMVAQAREGLRRSGGHDFDAAS